MGATPVVRKLLRGLYFVGLSVTLVGGTLGLIILLARLWAPGADSTQLARWLFAVVFIEVGLGGWAGLGRSWRSRAEWPSSSWSTSV